MQILYYFKEKDTYMDKWQRFHIFDELKYHDCNITVYNPLKYSTIDEANEKLYSFINNNTFDLFMTPHGSNDLYIDTLLKIKRKGIPTLLICFDSLMTPLNHKEIAKYFDLVMLSQQDKNGIFKSFKCNSISSPYAANPFLFKPCFNESIPNICFVGTPYGSRINKINLLLENKINVDLYSNFKSNNLNNNTLLKIDKIKVFYNLIRHDIGRRVLLGYIKQNCFLKNKLLTDSEYLKLNPPVDLIKMSYLFSNYNLSLSISDARNTGCLKYPVNIVHLRNFEIPMSAGLQICSYFEELSEYFEEDKEIIFYRSENEFIEKTKFYLKPQNERLRLNIKLAARKRAENEHTWFLRFKRAFDNLGLQNKYIIRVK